MSYEEIAVPDLILNVTAKEISKIEVTVNMADGSSQSTTLEEGNDIKVTYILNGVLKKEFAGRLKRIIHTSPCMSFELDSSTELNSEIVVIPLSSIRAINNLSFPENDKVINIPTTPDPVTPTPVTPTPDPVTPTPVTPTPDPVAPTDPITTT